MEIPPDSSIAQSTSLFSGRSKESVLSGIATQYPVSENNSLLDSSNRLVATSATNELTDFKFDDFREAHRMMNGPSKYPFQSIAQISNYKFDPYYFDGSENQPNFNVQENLIGTPLGTSLLEDPRLSYVKNLLTLKEYQGQADQLNDAYIKELYMVNSEKGSNYYMNMLEKQDEALGNWSRVGREAKNLQIDPISFSYGLPTGETQRPKNPSKIRVAQTMYSATPSVQRNIRQEIFNATPYDPRDEVNSRTFNDDSSTIVSDEMSVSYRTGRSGDNVSLGPTVTPGPRAPIVPLNIGGFGTRREEPIVFGGRKPGEDVSVRSVSSYHSSQPSWRSDVEPEPKESQSLKSGTSAKSGTSGKTSSSSALSSISNVSSHVDSVFKAAYYAEQAFNADQERISAALRDQFQADYVTSREAAQEQRRKAKVWSKLKMKSEMRRQERTKKMIQEAKGEKPTNTVLGANRYSASVLSNIQEDKLDKKWSDVRKQNLANQKSVEQSRRDALAWAEKLPDPLPSVYSDKFWGKIPSRSHDDARAATAKDYVAWARALPDEIIRQDILAPGFIPPSYETSSSSASSLSRGSSSSRVTTRMPSRNIDPSTGISSSSSGISIPDVPDLVENFLPRSNVDATLGFSTSVPIRTARNASSSLEYDDEGVSRAGRHLLNPHRNIYGGRKSKFTEAFGRPRFNEKKAAVEIFTQKKTRSGKKY